MTTSQAVNRRHNVLSWNIMQAGSCHGNRLSKTKQQFWRERSRLERRYDRYGYEL